MRSWSPIVFVAAVAMPSAASAQDAGVDTEPPPYTFPDPPQAPPPEPEPVVSAPEENLGGAGESCRARSDCMSGLRCLANVCRDLREGSSCTASSDCGPHLRCTRNVCRSPYAALLTADPPAEEDTGLRIRGVRGFIGASAMIGPTVGERPEATFLGGLRVGFFARENELALEVTPFSSVYALSVPVFQLNVSYGYLVPIARGSGTAVYWPLRFGVGFLTGNTYSNILIEARTDLLGIALQVGQVMIDFHVPSFRFAWTPSSSGSPFSNQFILHWFGGVSVSYIF